MPGDENRAEPPSNRRRAGDKAPKLVLSQEDESASQPVPAEGIAASDPVASAVPAKGLSLSQRRRRQHAQKLLLAVILTGVFISLVIWSRAGRRPNPEVQVPTIAPAVLFEQICTEIRKGHGDTLHIMEYPVDDAMVAAMTDLDSVETLIFDEGAVTDKAIETIAKLPKLQHLRLRLSPIGDEGMKQIATIQSLWYLNLPHAECTAEGVRELAALHGLRQLRLGSSNLGNDVTREIAKIPSLRGVHLIGIPVTDEGLKTLAAMKYLESLYLDDSAVTEAGWEWLFREYPHLHVHVDQIHHDRDPKAHKHH